MTLEGALALDVLDALGFCSLTRRSPTLDGQIPLRAAQGCQPLLEGNALGLQVTLPQPLLLRTSLLGSLTLGPPVDPAVVESLRRQHAVTPAWCKVLDRGSVQLLDPRKRTFRVWTGLLLRPRAGVVLWVTPPRNREHPDVTVAEQTITDTKAWTPLVLELTLARSAGDVTLRGEIATVITLQAGTTVERTTLAQAPEAGRAHLAFYDASYFAEKDGKVTTRYRRIMAQSNAVTSEPEGALTVVEAGPLEMEVQQLPNRAGVQAALFRNPVGLRAVFDGHAVTVDLHQASLKRGAAQVEEVWREVFGAPALEQGSGAMLYLTRFANLHPPAEPYFFVKPWALGMTPPGWSTVVEGVSGQGYRVLRGVVRTDRFHALPAVIQVLAPHQPMHLKASAPLLRAVAIPRSLQEPRFELQRLG